VPCSSYSSSSSLSSPGHAKSSGCPPHTPHTFWPGRSNRNLYDLVNHTQLQEWFQSAFHKEKGLQQQNSSVQNLSRRSSHHSLFESSYLCLTLGRVDLFILKNNILKLLWPSHENLEIEDNYNSIDMWLASPKKWKDVNLHWISYASSLGSAGQNWPPHKKYQPNSFDNGSRSMNQDLIPDLNPGSDPRPKVTTHLNCWR